MRSESSSPQVSVVVPVFNGETTIRRTVASVLRQSFGDFEILVIDDGSTDRTAAIVREFGDARIRLLPFENRGLAASRNRGIRAARGEFIAFLDADDLWLPDKLALQVTALGQHPGAALAYGWSDCIDAEDRLLLQGNHIEASGKVYEQLLLRNFFDNGSTTLVRAAAVGGSNIFDESLQAAEDWDLWLRLAWDHEVVCVPRVLTLYRVHAGAMSSNISRQAQECLKVLTAGVDRLPPSAHRERLRRQGQALQYRYLTGRALLGTTGRARGLVAAPYLVRYLRHASLDRESVGHITAQVLRILLILTLPEAWSRKALATIAAWSARRRRERD